MSDRDIIATVDICSLEIILSNVATMLVLGRTPFVLGGERRLREGKG
jgi:hypothetical protein